MSTKPIKTNIITNFQGDKYIQVKNYKNLKILLIKNAKVTAIVMQKKSNALAGLSHLIILGNKKILTAHYILVKLQEWK